MLNQTQVTIRKAVNSDFTEILNLYKQLWNNWQYFDEEKLKTIYQTDLETGRKQYLVAQKDNKIVGVCSLTIKNNWHYLKVADLEELIVDINHRHQGIGKMLLEEVLKVARENKCYRIQLHSHATRIETHKFYESNGFEKSPFYFTKKC